MSWSSLFKGMRFALGQASKLSVQKEMMTDKDVCPTPTRNAFQLSPYIARVTVQTIE
ncbi:MAG: hypothetical protein ABJB61_05710 [bacterium]